MTENKLKLKFTKKKEKKTFNKIQIGNKQAD